MPSQKIPNQTIGIHSWSPQYSVSLFDKEEPKVDDIPTLHPPVKDPSHIWQYKLIKIPDKPSPFMQQKNFPQPSMASPGN